VQAAQTAEREAAILDADTAERLRAAVGRLSRRLRPTLAGSGLTPSQTSVLFTIARRGPIGLTELASLEDMNPTMVSRIVVQLADLGLIRRESRRDDRRAATVSATAAGRRVRARVHSERAQALGKYVRELDAEQRRALLAALPALEALVERIGERRP
jgi:DNA-binding MarR family transcriptional regulator